MLRYLYRRAQLKGPLGGSRGWTVLWVALLGRRLLKRATKDKPDVVYSEVLRPGQSLVIRSDDGRKRAGDAAS